MILPKKRIVSLQNRTEFHLMAINDLTVKSIDHFSMVTNDRPYPKSEISMSA